LAEPGLGNAADDFIPIKLEFEKVPSQKTYPQMCPFTGLRRSVNTDTFLCGGPPSNTDDFWWNSIGSFKAWEELIPGPYHPQWGLKEKGQRSVQLWAWVTTGVDRT
jgi:hypothetical protein